MHMTNIKKIEFEHFVWIDITNPSKVELEALREEYNFHPLDIADCLKPSKRSKVDVYQHYTFASLLYPVYNREQRVIIPTEINFFISHGFIITVHHNTIKTFTDFVDLLRLTNELRSKYQQRSPELLLEDIFSKLFAYVFPIIDHLADDCDTIQDAIFNNRERAMVYEILLIRRNITETRKAMQIHRSAIRKIMHSAKKSRVGQRNYDEIHGDTLIETTKEIWESLENLEERIVALQQTNESRISFKITVIMRTLTIISMLTLPVTLVATLFGMNLMNDMPLLKHPNNFSIVVSLMAAIVLVLVIVFKKKEWL